MRLDNEKYCSNCGKAININAESCPYCGYRQQQTYTRYSPFGYRPNYDTEASDKNWLITLILCLTFGVFGAHRFYVGKIFTGILQLITFGGLGIWYLIDLIIIIVGSFKDDKGKYVKYM